MELNAIIESNDFDDNSQAALEMMELYLGNIKKEALSMAGK